MAMIRNTVRALAGLLVAAVALVLAAPSASARNPEHPWYSSTATICIEDNTGSAGFPLATAGARWGDFPSDMNFVMDRNCPLSERTITFNNVNNPDRDECVYYYQTYKFSDWKPVFVVDRSIAYMNLAHPACWSTPIRKAHMVSMALGYRLGMRAFSPTSISVMSGDTFSTVSWATDYDQQGVFEKQTWYWNP